MRGVEHFAHKSSSVVVLVIHQDCVFTLERKRQSPISVHLDRPVSRQMALQRMPVPTRNIHFDCALYCVQQLQLKLESRGMLRLDPCLRFGLEKPLNPVMLEAPYHSYSVTLRYTPCKRLSDSNLPPESFAKIGLSTSFVTYFIANATTFPLWRKHDLCMLAGHLL